MLVVTMTDGTRYATRTLPGDTGKPDAFAQGPAWTDAHIPRTEKPVRFAPAKFAYWYARWHMRPVYCRQSPLPRIGESVIYRDA